jgi:hypothetical protein
MVNVFPAIVRVPVRAGPTLAATVKATLAEPVPLPPAVIVIHASLLTAVQAQPAPVVTAVLLEAPPAATA